MVGMSINFEKEVLNMFMIFQLSYKLDEFCVAREDYRRLERKNLSIYRCERASVGIFVAILIVIHCIPFSDFYSAWVCGIADYIMLGLNAMVLRAGIFQNLTFFHKLYAAHRYEFDRHICRELTKQVLLLLSYCLIELAGLFIIFKDSMYVGCSAWARKLGEDSIVN